MHPSDPPKSDARAGDEFDARGRGDSTSERTDVPRFLVVGASWGWRILVVAAAFATLLWLVARLRIVVIPVAVSVILAALLAPAVELLDRVMPRILAVWTTLLGTVGALVGIGLFVRGPVVTTVDDLRSQWREAVADVKDWLVTGPLGLDRTRVDNAFTDIGDAASRAASGLFDEPASVARMATNIVTGVLLVIVLTFFALKDGPTMWHWFLSRIHNSRRLTIDSAGTSAFTALQGWIRGVAITGVVDGLLIGLALLVLGVPGALALGIITFFAAFFPIVGATLAGVLACAVALTTEGTQTAIIVAIVVLVVQQVEGDVLLPMVMSRQLSLHPAVILLALAVGAAVAGVLGAIVAVPVTAASVAATSAARQCGAAERLDIESVE